MEKGAGVPSSDVILAELSRLRRDPVLQQHLSGGVISSVATKDAPRDPPTMQAQEREPLSAFHARWGKEEERRLQQSLKAQRAFQQAHESLVAHRSNAVGAHVGRLAEAPAAEPERSSVGPSSDKSSKRESCASPGVACDAQTMEEKLGMRERTIQRLQAELDSTRATYEADIARMQEAHAQSMREAKQEMAELRERLTRLVPDGESHPDAAVADATVFLDALEFKERLLQELQDALLHASDEWKSGAMRAVTGMRVTVEEEVSGIMGRAESLVLQLQEALGALGRAGTSAAGTEEAAVVERLLQEEATLLSSYEEKLRDHVRVAVKSAVRARVKDVVRPLVAHELSRRPQLYAQRQRSSPTCQGEGDEAVGTTPPPSDELLSPADARYREALALFRELAPHLEPQTPSPSRGQQQQQQREKSAGNAAAEMLDGLLNGAALRHAAPEC